MPKEGKEVLFKTSRMDFKDLVMTICITSPRPPA